MSTIHIEDNEVKHIYANPDFKDVIVFYGIEAISFQNKAKAKSFTNIIKGELAKVRHDRWPYKNRLMIAIGIAGPTTMYSRKDVDNMSKSLLDAFKGIIYEDDRLIDILLIQKQLWDLTLYGFEIGIRVLNPDKKDKYTPILRYSFDIENQEMKQNVENAESKLFVFHFKNKADDNYIMNQIMQT